MEILVALLIGTFLSESTKNLAKGSANLMQESVKSRFDREFITLGLSLEDTPAEIQKKLEAKPEILEAVQQKLEANPDLIKELLEIIKQQTGKQTGGSNVNAKNVGQVINNPTGTINQNNNFS